MNVIKRSFLFLALLVAAYTLHAREQIVMETANNALVYSVGDNGRLYQSYLGKRLANKSDYALLVNGKEAYLTGGMEDYFEPALFIRHADGNPSTLLTYKSHSNTTHNNCTETVISMSDPAYGDEVKLHVVTYPEQDIFKCWTEITNKEKGSITLERYASSMLHFTSPKYFLTQYDGDWANEVNQHTQQLNFGKKTIDTNLGTRATMFTPPFFQLGLGEPAKENSGDVLVGTLAWSGNFRFTFEVDNFGDLRVISGINPYASQYPLAKGESITTPEFIFTISHSGTGMASRNLHDWARLYQIKDGQGKRMTLLNNWEATYFDFDEQKIVSLIKDAKDLGVDMFLLDDGWFGNKYPRQSDTQGLGDWQETASKLPNGLKKLTDEAKQQGVKFGLWIEPEMVNPKSELYEKHKDWVITLPNRKEYYFRNQLVLDLSNPKVQDYVFGVIDNLKTKYPDIAFFKWDCNSPITNIYSNYEHQQSKLYVDYVRGLYKVFDRVKAKYPDLPMMLCAGGGGRTDYGALRYFPEMWVSDDTDPIERLFIQWGYSQVFPTKVQCAHVTSWNKDASLKFRINVAMMGLLGFDINLHELSEKDLDFCKRSVSDYKEIQPIVIDGDQYRLVSPYSGNHTATMFVSKDRNRAVAFAFDIFPRFGVKLFNLKFDGLDRDAKYTVAEINREDGKVEKSQYTGDYLMTIGLPAFSHSKLSSRVYELTKER